MKALYARRESGVALVLVLTVVVVTLVNHSFLSATNISDMLVQCAPGMIIGCGLTLVIVTGEIDISIGSLMGLLAAVMGLLTTPEHLGLPVSVGVVLTLFLGTAVGLVNGFLVTVGRAPSIIVTLGMLTTLRGATELLMDGRWITGLPAKLRFLGTGSVTGVRVSLWTVALVIAAAMMLVRGTPLGQRIYAVGSNPQAARLAGLSLIRVKLFVFTLTGFLVGIATIISVPQLSTIESGIGIGLELFVVTAVMVGGASISGGKGTIIGTIFGVLLLGIVRTVLIFLNLGEHMVYWERAIQGGFILVAVVIDRFAKRRPN